MICNDFLVVKQIYLDIKEHQKIRKF